MASRLDLQTQLEEILGTRNVYYQPPESIKLKYPCIVYKLDGIDTKSANNHNYIVNKSYQLTLIDEDPDSDFVDRLLELPNCNLATSPYGVDGLNHFIFTIYY